MQFARKFLRDGSAQSSAVIDLFGEFLQHLFIVQPGNATHKFGNRLNISLTKKTGKE